jgi:hypothetical protein
MSTEFAALLEAFTPALDTTFLQTVVSAVE